MDPNKHVCGFIASRHTILAGGFWLVRKSLAVSGGLAGHDNSRLIVIRNNDVELDKGIKKGLLNAI